MKNINAKIGMEVVVNYLEDTTIYFIKELDGFRVKLFYYSENGTLCNGGYSDTSLLKKPSKKQLIFRDKQKEK